MTPALYCSCDLWTAVDGSFAAMDSGVLGASEAARYAYLPVLASVASLSAHYVNGTRASDAAEDLIASFASASMEPW